MLEVYTDGSSTGKVGEGGWAFVVLQDGQVVHEDSAGADDTTNNRMELSAMIEGLRYVYKQYTNQSATFYSDSQYVVKGMTEWYPAWERKMAKGKTIKNQDLWLEYKQLYDLFVNIDIKWVKGHSGVIHNERCDVLAKQAKEDVRLKRDGLR